MMSQRPRKILNIPANCRTCSVRNDALCAPLSDGEIAVVEHFKSGNRMLSAGAYLYGQDEVCRDLYTLLDGWVCLYQMLEDGRRQILDFALPGAFLGFQPDLDSPASHSAYCLTDIAVCVFPRENLFDLFRAHPELALRMAWITARDGALAREHLTNVGRRSARERVAHLLLELFYRVRRRAGDGAANTIDLPLTQEHIADALGLTTVHVNRTLGKLRQADLLDIHGRTLTVRDPAALAEIAGFDAEAVLEAVAT